jgi:hypothetical protein
VPSALAVLGLVLVQRLVPWSHRKEFNDVAGFIYAVVGVAYAVLLALVVIGAWEYREVARDNMERGKRGGRDLLARPWAPGNRGPTTSGAHSLIRSNGGG